MNFKGSTQPKETPIYKVKRIQPRHVSDYMAKHVISFSAEQPLWEAIDMMLKKKISGGPVLDERGMLIGMLSEKDCIRILIDTAYNNYPHQNDKVKDYMSLQVQTVTEDQDILEVAKAFLSTNYRRFPVINAQGALMGQVSRRDIIRAAKALKSTLW